MNTLARFLQGIEDKRNEALIRNVQSLSPYLHAEVNRIDRDAEILKQRDQAISDNSNLMLGEGYNTEDVKGMSDIASTVSNPNLVSTATSNFKKGKELKSKLASLNVEIPDGATHDDLEALYSTASASHKHVEDMRNKAQTLGFGAEFSAKVDLGMDPDEAYSEIIKENVDPSDIEEKAKSLGTKYYNMYKVLIDQKVDPRVALADVDDRKKQDNAKASKASGGGQSGDVSTGYGGTRGTGAKPTKEYQKQRDKVKPPVPGGYVYFRSSSGALVRVKATVNQSGTLVDIEPKSKTYGKALHVDYLIPEKEALADGDTAIDVWETYSQDSKKIAASGKVKGVGASAPKGKDPVASIVGKY